MDYLTLPVYSNLWSLFINLLFLRDTHPYVVGLKEETIRHILFFRKMFSVFFFFFFSVLAKRNGDLTLKPNTERNPLSTSVFTSPRSRTKDEGCGTLSVRTHSGGRGPPYSLCTPTRRVVRTGSRLDNRLGVWCPSSGRC